MADRLTYLDAVCPACKRAVSRAVVQARDLVTVERAEIRGRGLLPFHYTSLPKPDEELGHAPACSRAA